MPTSEERRKIGQLFAVGFHGHEVDDSITSLICDYGVGTVILFRRNIADAAQLQNLCLELQRTAHDAQHAQPLLIAIDQENGLVTRIAPPIAPQQPGAMAVAAAAVAVQTDSLSDRSFRVARATGEMLDFFGINLNYAPVGDVNSEPLNPVIGVRSAGDDPAAAAAFASGYIRGLREHLVVPCIKHFPGHGDTRVDSHYGLPVINKSRAQLDEVELVPFRRAVVDDGVDMVMTAHIALPQLAQDPGSGNLPATLSPHALGILRDEWGYEGVVVTDCMEMDGVRASYGTVEGSVMALGAGVDCVMICHTYEVQAAAVDRVCGAVESGELSRDRIDASLRRLAELKDKYTSWEKALRAKPLQLLDAINAEGALVAREVYADAVTLVRQEAGALPLSPEAQVVLVTPSPDVFSLGGAADGDASGIGELFVSAFEGRGLSPVHIQFDDGLSFEQWGVIDKAEVVVLATQNAQDGQRGVGLEMARRRNRPLVVCVATCSPYDFLGDETVGTYMTIYEPTREAIHSAVDVLYGASARGRLPVKHTSQ